jgi:hypothetical protein
MPRPPLPGACGDGRESIKEKGRSIFQQMAEKSL